MHRAYREALAALPGAGNTRAPTIAVGFDGYIDLLVRPVRKHSGDQKEYFETIKEFGEYLAGKAALSCSLELDKVAEKAGGNMPLYMAALSALGARGDCIGALGHPEPHGMFALGDGVRITGVTGPGTCTALEFRDGKVMLAYNAEVERLDYPLLEERVGRHRLTEWLRGADAAAFLNWSELRGSTSIWKGLLADILPGLVGERKLLLLDLSDCSQRSDKEILEMIGLARRLGEYFRLALSLNRNEAQELCRVLGHGGKEPPELAELLYRETGAELLVLHLLDGAWLRGGEGEVEFIPSQHIDTPAISTGGGDNFNAGLTWGLLWGLSGPASVATGNAVSSFYVSKGRSPGSGELLRYIEEIVGRNNH